MLHPSNCIVVLASPDIFFSCLAANISNEQFEIVHKQIENITTLFATKVCDKIISKKKEKSNYTPDYTCAAFHPESDFYHLKTSSARKKKFLELVGTSKTMDISIEIDNDLKNSTAGKNDFRDILTTSKAEVMASNDIKGNGEL